MGRGARAGSRGDSVGLGRSEDSKSASGHSIDRSHRSQEVESEASGKETRGLSPRISPSVPRIPQDQEADQVKNGDGRGGNIRERCGVEHLLRHRDLFAAGEKPARLQLLERAARGVEFNWQRNHLKRHGSGEENNPERQ